jgi:autotransporter strand-loop-strand O-heptosyltransferase
MNSKENNTQINFVAGLGDTIAWLPYVDLYQKKTGENVFCKAHYSEIFSPEYDNLHFIDLRSKDILNTKTICGYRYDIERSYPMQEVAAFSLGIDYIGDIRPKVFIQNKKNNFNRPYVCIATKSTCQAKYWNNPTGWGQTIKYLKSLGYEVVCIDQFSSYGNLGAGIINETPPNVIDKTGKTGKEFSLDDRITDLFNCSFFIGLCSGLSWLSWALNKPTIMIGGFTDPKIEFNTPYRVINKNVCTNCWEEHGFDRKDWLWCPRKRESEDIFECSKKISFEMVKEKIDLLIKDNF